MLPRDKRKAADEVMALFKEIDSHTTLGLTDKMTMTIYTGDNKPPKQQQYPLSPFILEKLKRVLDEMLKLAWSHRIARGVRLFFFRISQVRASISSIDLRKAFFKIKVQRIQ